MTSFDLISAYRAGFRRGIATDCAAAEPGAALAVLGIPVNQETLDCYQTGADDGLLGLTGFYEKVCGMAAAGACRSR